MTLASSLFCYTLASFILLYYKFQVLIFQVLLGADVPAHHLKRLVMPLRGRCPIIHPIMMDLVSFVVDPCLKIWCFRPVLQLFSKHQTPHPYSCRSSLPCYFPDVFIAAPCSILELHSDPPYSSFSFFLLLRMLRHQCHLTPYFTYNKHYSR